MFPARECDDGTPVRRVRRRASQAIAGGRFAPLSSSCRGCRVLGSEPPLVTSLLVDSIRHLFCEHWVDAGDQRCWHWRQSIITGALDLRIVQLAAISAVWASRTVRAPRHL